MSDPAADASDMIALQGGEAAALDRLMGRWQQPLQSYLRRIVGHPEDARDLAQETFVRIYRHRTRFRPEARFSTWLFQIALNLARDHHRQRQRRPSEALAASVQETAEDAPHPRAHAEAADRAVAVRDAIAELPDSLRDPLILAEYQHLSHAEIAQVIGSSPKAVESRLYRARDLLRQRLRRWL